VEDTRVCLGSEAIKLQKKDVLRRQKELNELFSAIREKQQYVQKKIRSA